MKKYKLLTKPTRLEDLSFEDMDGPDPGELRMERLEVRESRRVKQGLA